MFNAKGLRTGAALATLLVLAASCADHRLSTESPPPANQPTVPTSGTTSPIGQLSDEFAGTEINAEWWQAYGVAGSVRQDNRLIVQLSPNSTQPAGLMTSLPHGLAGSSFAAEISQIAGGTNTTETSVSVMTADQQQFVIVSSFGGKLSVWYKRRGENHRQLGTSITFHAGNHRFRRIREQGGTIRVEVSAQGTTWTQPSGWSIASFFTTPVALYGNIGARTFDTSNGQPTAAIFEGVNTPVPAIPSTVSATLTTPTQAQLTWQDRSVNETGFHIERRAADGAFVEIGTVGSNATQYSDPTLAAGTTYEYRVRAFNGQGSSAPSPTASVTTAPPGNTPPFARAGGPYSGNEGALISFDGSASTPGGSALTYSWSLGDGASATGVSASHRYADNGSFQLILTVTDSTGISSADTTSVTVGNVAPAVAFSLSSSSPNVGQSITLSGSFTDPGVDDAPWTWHVDWGDGTTNSGSAAQPGSISATHAYTTPGSRTVQFRVTDKDGAASTSTTVVAVQSSTVAIHTVVDEFAGTIVNWQRWMPYGDQSRTTQDDRLIITLTPNVAGYGGVISRERYSLAGSFFLAEISQAAAGGSYTETVIAVTTLDEEEYVVISNLGGTIGAYYKWRGENWRRISAITYNPVNHRFRRIREEGGTIYFELSANGVNWTRPSGWSVVHRFTDITAMHGMAGAGAYYADANAGTAIFENVNTTVPAIPSTVSATLTAATQAQLTWQDRSVNESGFRIERRAGNGAFVQIGSVGSNATQYSDPTLIAGTTYEYRVLAFNAQGSSAPSPTASVTTAP